MTDEELRSCVVKCSCRQVVESDLAPQSRYALVDMLVEAVHPHDPAEFSAWNV